MTNVKPATIPLLAPAAQPAGRRRTWRTAAWIAGAFCLVLGGGLVLSHFAGKDRDPWRSPQLLAAKEKLRQQPRDEATKKQIRQLDLELRRRYFQELSRMSFGTLLLLGGLGLFLAAYGQAVPKPLPQPGPKGSRREDAAPARWAVAGVGLTAAAGLFWASLYSQTGVPKALAALSGAAPDAGTSAATGPDAASSEELARNWPRFLGWQGGPAVSTNPPLKWDAASGQGIAWKVPAAIQGFNSPIVWGNRMFYSGGGAAEREVVCLDAQNGQLLWRTRIANVPGTPAQAPEIPESTGYAAPSMATDGRRVYAMFGNGDLAALSFEGKVLWSKGFGALKNVYGHANSLATWRDRVIVQLDQGEVEDNKSKLYALDGRTGKVVWERPRKAGASWASPLVFEHAGKGQIVCLSLPHAISYSAQDGAELWRVDCLNGEVCPSPIYAGGLVLVASPSDRLVAIRPDGTGDVTKSHLAWSTDENVPDVTSPASDGQWVFMVTTGGTLACVDAKTGKQAWVHEYENEFHSSPVVAGSRVYLVSQKGAAIVVEASGTFKELFRTEMGDSFHASPAVVQDRIYLRGLTNAWCLGAAAAGTGGH